MLLQYNNYHHDDLVADEWCELCFFWLLIAPTSQHLLLRLTVGWKNWRIQQRRLEVFTLLSFRGTHSSSKTSTNPLATLLWIESIQNPFCPKKSRSAKRAYKRNPNPKNKIFHFPSTFMSEYSYLLKKDVHVPSSPSPGCVSSISSSIGYYGKKNFR